DADHPPPAHDPVNAGHRPMQMTARVFENAASPTGDGVEIDTLDPPTAPALKPRSSLLVPNHQNGVPVDQNIRCPSGEQAMKSGESRICVAAAYSAATTAMGASERMSLARSGTPGCSHTAAKTAKPLIAPTTPSTRAAENRPCSKLRSVWVSDS